MILNDYQDAERLNGVQRVRHPDGGPVTTDAMCQCITWAHDEDCLFFDPIEDGALASALAADASATSLLLPLRSLCTHALDPFVLTDGTTVYASAHRDAALRTYEPDLGIYLDSCWHARTIAFSIGWQDYGLPSLPDCKVVAIAEHALTVARGGGMVEVGCIGGHGRTGTFLAILDVLTQDVPDAVSAIAHVRREHCMHAIETADQEWFVACIAAQLREEADPPRPTYHAGRESKAKRKKAKGTRTRKSSK